MRRYSLALSSFKVSRSAAASFASLTVCSLAALSELMTSFLRVTSSLRLLIKDWDSLRRSCRLLASLGGIHSDLS
jgi:hypothetical protein